jgi:hypothetical protein
LDRQQQLLVRVARTRRHFIFEYGAPTVHDAEMMNEI